MTNKSHFAVLTVLFLATVISFSLAQPIDCEEEDEDLPAPFTIPNSDCQAFTGFDCSDSTLYPQRCVRDFGGGYWCRAVKSAALGDSCIAFLTCRGFCGPGDPSNCDASRNQECRADPVGEEAGGKCVQIVAEGEACVKDGHNEENVGCAGQDRRWKPDNTDVGFGNGPAMTCRDGICVKVDS